MTDQPKFTPGPWAYYAETATVYRADDDVEPTIAAVDLSNVDEEQAFFDGLLIAAAPDMFAALAEFIAIDEDSDPTSQDRIDAAFAAARAALAKARGQA